MSSAEQICPVPFRWKTDLEFNVSPPTHTYGRAVSGPLHRSTLNGAKSSPFEQSALRTIACLPKLGPIKICKFQNGPELGRIPIKNDVF